MSSEQTVWDLLEKKKVVKFFVAGDADFTPDGRFAFACASSEFGGDYYGVVVNLATGKNVYTMPVEESKLVPLPSVTCSMKTNTVVEFTVKNQDTGEILKTFEYSLL